MGGGFCVVLVCLMRTDRKRRASGSFLTGIFHCVVWGERNNEGDFLRVGLSR